MSVTTILKRDNVTTPDSRIFRVRIVDRTGTPKSVVSDYLGEISEICFLLNPNSMDIAMSQKITQVKTIGGYVILHWGHDLDTMSVSGYTPAFYLTYEELASKLAGSITLPISNKEGEISRFLGEHLAAKDRDISQGFRHFKSILDIYRHNGIDVDKSSGHIQRSGIGMIEIIYQNIVYRGHFESFNIKEDENNPYSLQYDFTFKVLKEITPLPMRSAFNYNEVRFNLSLAGQVDVAL